MVEVVISVVLVGGLLVASLHLVAAAAGSDRMLQNVSRGQTLAEELLTEITRKAYEDPDDAPVFGREAGELAVTRSAFDDVDDYNGWSSSPPQAADGTPLSAFADWTRQVRVRWVTLGDPEVLSLAESGVKRIDVQVKDPAGRLLGQATALRTKAGDVINADPGVPIDWQTP
ncbi:MAG: hypothetical protein D6788_05785 [Planctomycetota bacterium]|nr:MAG: hypothetical protein D6788_05785 [Planctomycetota bacterium]